jgi:hypothetical protein
MTGVYSVNITLLDYWKNKEMNQKRIKIEDEIPTKARQRAFNLNAVFGSAQVHT